MRVRTRLRATHRQTEIGRRFWENLRFPFYPLLDEA